jgi:hypothetical protein
MSLRAWLASAVREDMDQFDGRCTDRSYGPEFTAADAAAAAKDTGLVCNTFIVKVRCIPNKQCMWLASGDMCACTFDGCSCASPIPDRNQTITALSMALVLGPTCTLFVCAIFSALGFVHRERVSRALMAICPPSIMAKLEVKDTLDEQEPVPQVTTEEPSDSEAEREAAAAAGVPPPERRKRKVDRHQERREYRGTWMLTVFVERAQHLPCLDTSYRDPHLVGATGPPLTPTCALLPMSRPMT